MPVEFLDAKPDDALPIHLVAKDGLEEAGLQPAVRVWAEANGFAGEAGKVLVVPGVDGKLAGALFGTGKDENGLGFGALARSLPVANWHFARQPAHPELAALGTALGGYVFTRYGKKPGRELGLSVPEGVDGARLKRLVEAVFLVRNLVNTPTNDMGPSELEGAVRGLAQLHGAQVAVTLGDDLLRQNFPMIHAVGRASPRAPRLLEMRWGTAGPQLTLVGKGVCFDTGGLNIKTGTYMQLMKKDMGGAATVLGLALMIMRLGLPLRLRVLIPAVENVISGNALKPKDILTSRKGLTVEVNDTDAEGRLVLADALALACEEPCDLLISMATLTGAARVAVGPDLAPYYTDDEAVAQALETGARAGFDPVWRMPFWTPYEPVIEPGIADLDNAPGFGFAGSVTAALFLRRFAEGARYLHFDIYGHTPSDQPARPKGAVGQGARALLGGLPAMLGL